MEEGIQFLVKYGACSYLGSRVIRSRAGVGGGIQVMGGVGHRGTP